MQELVTLCMSDIGRLLGALVLLSLGITPILWGLKRRRSGVISGWRRSYLHPRWIWGLVSLLLVILLWIPQLVTAEDTEEVLTRRYPPAEGIPQAGLIQLRAQQREPPVDRAEKRQDDGRVAHQRKQHGASGRVAKRQPSRHGQAEERQQSKVAQQAGNALRDDTRHRRNTRCCQ